MWESILKCLASLQKYAALGNSGLFFKSTAVVVEVPVVKSILSVNAGPLSSALFTCHKMLRVKSGKMPKSWVSSCMELLYGAFWVLFLKEKTSCWFVFEGFFLVEKILWKFMHEDVCPYLNNLFVPEVP